MSKFRVKEENSSQSITFQVGTDKKKLKDRYVVLCDGLLIVCYQTTARRPSTNAMSGSTSVQGELRYRDKYMIRLINISDREDEEGIKNSFELCPRDQQRVRNIRHKCWKLPFRNSLCH